MTTPLNVIVTGSNRGIGKAICSLIVSRQQRNPAIKLFAASRKGEETTGPQADRAPNVVFPKLDIASDASIRAFADRMGGEGGGKIDVLINNAGVNLDDRYSPANAKTTLDVNYRGTLKMCETFIPLLSPRGRIVNMSSVASSLRPYHESIQRRFRNPEMTLQELEQLVEEYERSVEQSNEKDAGFVGQGRAYSFSKSCINAFTRILAKDNPGLIINACCPGWVNTDMGILVGNRPPPKTPEQGALIPDRLAFEDIGDVSGEYWANDNVRSKEVGQVQKW